MLPFVLMYCTHIKDAIFTLVFSNIEQILLWDLYQLIITWTYPVWWKWILLFHNDASWRVYTTIYTINWGISKHTHISSILYSMFILWFHELCSRIYWNVISSCNIISSTWNGMCIKCSDPAFLQALLSITQKINPKVEFQVNKDY